MSLANLNTAISNNKVVFDSLHPIDKVVNTGTTSIVNDGNTTATGTGTGAQRAKITTTTITNPYGKRCFVRFIWSIDGANFNSADSYSLFSYDHTLTDIPDTSILFGLRAGVSIGIDTTNITILTGSGYHGNVSRLSSDPDTSGYTPISQTFTVKYALFEIEPNG